jgi:hypothetical protein
LTPGKIQALKEGLKYIKVLTDDDLEHFDHREIAASLSRNTGADILDLISDVNVNDPVIVSLQLDFVKDELYCEWAYVVDLDDEVLEVYKGNDDGMQEGRLAAVEGCKVGLVADFAFSKLPPDEDDRIKECKAALVEEGDSE